MFRLADFQLVLRDGLARFLLLGLQLEPERGDLSVQRLAFALEEELLSFNFLPDQQRPGGIFGFLRHTGGTGEQSRFAQIDVAKFDAVIGQKEFANLIRMGNAAGLEDVEAAVALAPALDIAQQQPRIHQGRDAEPRFVPGRPSRWSGWSSRP